LHRYAQQTGAVAGVAEQVEDDQYEQDAAGRIVLEFIVEVFVLTQKCQGDPCRQAVAIAEIAAAFQPARLPRQIA